MPEDQLYAGITETLKKHGIGLPAAPTAMPASEITPPAPKDDLLSGIHETLQKHGIGVPGGPQPAPALPKPAGEATIEAPQAISPALPKREDPALYEEPVIGAKEALADHVARWSSWIDPGSFMSGAGVDPNAPGVREALAGAPETRQERLKVGRQAMTAGLFPEGEPAPPANLGRAVLRGVGAAPVALTELAMLAPLAGEAPAIAKGAITFALQGLTGEEPIKGAAHGAALGAILGVNHQLAGKIADPVVQWLAKIAGGMTIGGGATALAGGGAQEITRDAIIFGLFEVMGMPRGKQTEGKWSIDWKWMEDQKVPKETIDALKYEDVDSPGFVKAADDASRSLFGKTPQPETPTAEAQKEAIFGGDVKDLIESKENRADAIQALVPKIGDQARAEQFYDLYQKGDAATALKEFPEMSAWATEQQKAAQKAPEVPAPMASSGATTEAQAAAPAPEPGEVRPAASADMVTSPAHAVNPAGRENTTETPAEAAKLSESPAPKASPELEPPSSAPAQAGGGGTVGLSATPAGEVKPVAVAEPAGPPTPMGSPGSVAEAAAKPPGVEEFMGKFGSRQGPPDVGMTAEPLPKVWLPPSKRSRTYDFDRAAEHGDIDTMILSKGGFDSKSEIFNNFEPEERLKLFRYMRSKEKFPTVKGPDVMFEDLKTEYPHLFPWETEADFLMALVRGDHKKALMGDKVYEDLEAQHDYNLKAAKREGHSPEDVAAAEAELERQIAAEEIAGRGAKPGEYDTSWDTATFGLSPREKPASKLNTRLDELAADYPDIDREKAATVLRAFPDVENNHIAAMSADPEMFSQVARGNLKAQEKAQLLKKATDTGAQGDLFGGGEAGAGKLFKVGETGDELMERLKIKSDLLKGRMTEDEYNKQYAGKYGEWGSPEWSENIDYFKDVRGKDGGINLFKAGEDLAFTRGLTTEQIQGRLGKKGIVTELSSDTFPADSPYARGWSMRLENGQLAMVLEGKDGSLKVGPNDVPGGWAELGITSLEGKTIAGSFKPVSFGSVIELARGQGLRAFDHESWHMIEHWLLTDKERAAIIRDFGDNEEVRAEAYAKWNPKEAPNTVFQKIMDFFQRITKAITGKVTGEDVFAAARKGELFGREPMEFLPDAMSTSKYRVAEGGEWGMEGGLAGRIKGDAKTAREEGKAAKDWLMNLFASNRTSREALKTHQIIAGSQAESATEKLRMQNVFMKYVEGMGPIKGEATQEFLRLYESGQEAQITHPVFKAFAEEFRAEERRHMEIMTMLGDAPKEIPNYIDHLWKENEAREKIKAQLNAQVTGGRSMRGPDYYKLLRTVVDIPSGIAQGLEPRFDTLPEMVLAGRSARENRIAATKRLKFIKENGYEKVVRDMEGGKYTVADAQGNEQTFRSINEARRFATENPGSSDPRFEPDVPQGWKAYPGGYGEVWAKIKRPGGAMIPGVADEETMPMGGGPGRAGYVEVPKVDAWSRVGYRVGPEDVVRQFDDFLGRGLSGNTAFELYQSGLHAVRHSQMALSFFHAFFESINAVATHAGSGIFDSLGGLFTGDWQRMGAGLKTVATSPIAPWTDIGLGLDINKTLIKNGVGIPGEATDNQLLKDARTLVGGGMRPEAESELAKILARHFKEAWKLKGSPGKAGYELLQGLSSPTMEVIVPFSKQGSTMFQYLNEVKRWERENPGVTPTGEDLRNIAYECRQTADYIYGRMAKDNVAMNATVKSLLTGVLQFPTWQFGTVGAGVRSMIGAKDVMGKVFDMMQGREIRKLDIKDRQALQYVTGLLFTVGMTGALMTYAFTGKPPETMADYFFPKTGEVNPNGSEERLQLPSYFKDAMGIKQHFFKTVGAKLASPIHILSDLIANKDYWGTQIYDPHDWIGQRGVDVLKYMAKTTAPFALQSYEQGAKGGPGRFGMSLLGVRPVPRETANTAAQNVIDEYNQLMRASTTTKESAEKKTLKSDLMKMARDQDAAGFKEATDKAVSEGKLTRQQVKELVAESQAPPSMGRFIRLPLEWATRAWKEASDYEKEQWQPYFLKKVMAEKPENLIKQRDQVVEVLNDMGLSEAANAVTNLTMPEETGVDLTGLGIQGGPPKMAGMETIDAAIAAIMENKLQGKTKPISSLARPASTREKKRPYEVLGL